MLLVRQGGRTEPYPPLMVSINTNKGGTKDMDRAKNSRDRADDGSRPPLKKWTPAISLRAIHTADEERRMNKLVFDDFLPGVALRAPAGPGGGQPAGASPPSRA